MTLREQVFRKMGAEVFIHAGEKYWVYDGEDVSDEYGHPFPIDEQWEVCAKHLVPFMRKKGWRYLITDDENYGLFRWFHIHKDSKFFKDKLFIDKVIKNDNIAEAACKAFMEVELEDEKENKHE